MGVPEEWTNTTYWMVFDPKVKGRVWSVTAERTICRVQKCGATLP